MFEHEPRLGELLVGHGLVTSKQLKAALEAQVVHGARLGTNLVELGFINIDQLALALGEQHGVPAASQRAFENVSSGALGAMPRSMGAACGACPLLLDGRTLHVAMLDPHRMDLIQHIGRSLGMTILSYAAPQARLLYWLEKHYQIRRPQRYLRTPPPQEVEGDRRNYLSAASDPHAASVPSTTGPNHPGVGSVSVGGGGPLRSSSGKLHLVDLGDSTSGLTPTADDFDIDISFAPSEEQVSVLEPEVVLEALQAATERSTVVKLLAQPILSGTQLVVVFLVRGEFAVALAAWGTDIEADRVQTLVVPLNVASLFRHAIDSAGLVKGLAAKDSVQQLITNFLQSKPPREACVVPICIGTSAVNLLCVQSSTPIDERGAANLRLIGQAAGQAYANLIQGELRSPTGDTIPAKPDAIWDGLATGSFAGQGSVMPLNIPQQDSQRRFGRYTLLCRFASGGMANLYLAKLAGPGRFEKLIAIKRIHDHLTNDKEFIQRFTDEARLAARISHPNVVQVIELGRVASSHFIAMEYVDGEDLAALLNRTELPHRIAGRIIANAAAGLHAAHQLCDGAGELLNVVHRDVSPQNLLISYQGEVKVVDFGVAQARGNLAHSIVGTILGKLGYMAPEQARGEALDCRTDVYALGIVLYEITTRRRLYKADSEAATMNLVLKAEVTPPSAFFDSYPAELEEVVLKALQKEPDDRYASAEELQLALEQYINFTGKPVLAGEVAQLMEQVFADRIKQKKELLQQLTGG